MEEKVNILGVRLDCLSAKTAMQEALRFLESDSIDTISIVSMDMLMKGQENVTWQKQTSSMTLTLPGEAEILDAAGIEDRGRQREAAERIFLKMFMKYLQKNHKRVFLLADSGEELEKVEEAVGWYNRGIRIAGHAVLDPQAESVEKVINDINGTETDCILSVLPSPYQEEFIQKNKALLNARVWLGCGAALRMSYDERNLRKRLKRFFMKKLFRYRVDREKENDNDQIQRG